MFQNVSTTNIIQNHVKNNNKKCNFLLNYVFPIKQSFLNDLFLKTLKMFSIAKIIFFSLYRVQKKIIIIIKISGQKIRTADIVVAVFLLYRCTVNASTLHAARHDTIVCGGDRQFSIIFFFGERRAR